MAINLAGTLPPELYEQQQQLNRQQQMAQLLMQQGQQQPQGQMVSGRYVAPSFFQNIAPLAQMYAGTRLAEKSDKQALELAAKLRQRYGDELKEFRKLQQGTPDVEGGIYGADNKLTMQTTPDMYDANMELNPQYRKVAPVAAVAPNVQGAYDFAATAYNPALQAAGLRKLTEGPIKVGIEDTLIDPVTMKPIFTGAGKPRTPLQIDTGTAIELRDPNNPTVVLQRIPKSQMPAAGQVVETANGPMIVNTRTGDATPIWQAANL
jgi:protein involved in polysaccharide export with SLBB domain